jgi:GntR family transcriptional regulator
MIGGMVLYKTSLPAAVNMPKNIAAGDFRPLYTQVRDTLFERIKSGTLRPGAELGSEFQLAAELGVSQGTVRKALEQLRAEKLLIRRQGRGTFVAEQTPASVLFRFFNIFDDGGEQVIPDSQQVRVSHGIAGVDGEARLRISPGDEVIQIRRVRTRRVHIPGGHGGLHDRPFIDETILLPHATFPGLGKLTPMPNTLYDLFQRHYGITVTRIDEKITPTTASSRVAEQLGLDIGTPLLTIDRTTFSLGEKIVEWRLSHCHMSGCHYRMQVR